MKNPINELEVNLEYLRTHTAVPFTLTKRTTGTHIYSWNTAPRFFPEEMKEAMIRIRYLMGNASSVGLDDLAMPDQPAKDKLIEECHEITYEEFVEYYNSEIYRKQGTIWNIDKRYNTIFMTKETHDRILKEFGRSVSLVFPAADCAVVRFYDPKREVIGLTHSDASRTTEDLIGSSIQYMQEHFGSNIEDIEVYVGAFAMDGWTYDTMPPFAALKDEEGNIIGIREEWQGYIEEIDGKFIIHYGDKVYDQIIASGVSTDHIYFDPNNTLFDENYFSNARSYHSRVDGVPTDREGRNLMGITFHAEEMVEHAEENKVELK